MMGFGGFSLNESALENAIKDVVADKRKQEAALYLSPLV